MQTLSIDNPTDGSILSGDSSITIRATVMNTATHTQSNVPVNLTISDGVSYTYTDVETTGTLVQDQTQQMIFAPGWIVPTSFAVYTIMVKTALAGDEYPADDSLIIAVVGVPPGYTTEDFEGTFPPADWTLQSKGTYTAPWMKSSTHAHTGTYSAQGNYSSSGYTNEWLITPRLDLSVKSGGTLQLWKRFYAGTASFPDTLEILMSEDGGSTWPAQLAQWTPDSTSDDDFVVRTFSLSSYSNNVMIAFRYASKNGSASYIDDVILPPAFVPPVICGDANEDGTVTVSDVVYLINYLYRGGIPPDPLLVGDVNCVDLVDVSDIVYLINWLYRGGNDPCDPNGDGIPDC
jgi:hypothetical protein